MPTSKLSRPDNVELLTHVLNRLPVSKPVEETDFPTVDELMGYLDGVLEQAQEQYAQVGADLRGVLLARGRQYGEEVLAVMGEQGISEFVKVKVWRLIGSIREGNPESSREDSWIDIAGYAMLAIAFRRWQEQKALLDRGNPHQAHDLLTWSEIERSGL